MATRTKEKKSKSEQLSELMWLAISEILKIIFTEHSDLLKTRLVDLIYNPQFSSKPDEKHSYQISLADELRDKISALDSVKKAHRYLDKYFPDRLTINAKARGYANPNELSGEKDILILVQDILGLIFVGREPKNGSLKKEIFNHAFNARYLEPIKRIFIRPLYYIKREDFSCNFEVSPSLHLRTPNRIDRYVLYCGHTNNMPHAELVLSYEEDISKKNKNMEANEIEALEFCMHLYVWGDYLGFSTLQYVSSGLLPYGQSGTISHHSTPMEFPRHLLLDDGLQKIKDNFSQVNKFFSKSSFGVSIRRFNESFRRLSAEDKLLDLCIAYEALFSDSGDKSALSYKLAQRGALTVEGGDLEKRMKEYQRLKKAYDVRSSLVHGKKVNRKTLTEKINVFEMALKRGYKYCIKYNLLKHDQWLARCLSV